MTITATDRLANAKDSRVEVLGDWGEAGVRVRYLRSGTTSVIAASHLVDLHDSGPEPTHVIEHWSTNFRGERVYADEFYGSREECEDAYRRECEREREPWSPWNPGYHVALRRIGSSRVTKHNGPSDFSHTHKGARYV